MVTEKQAFNACLGFAERATKNADARWQLVVDELKQKIAELEAELDQLKNRRFAGEPYSPKELEQMGNPNYVTPEGWISWE